MTDRGYSDPAALRLAVTDRLRQLARDRPGDQLSDLLRQCAYDRLPTRLFSAERDLEAASATVKRFLDPILAGDVAGKWTPGHQRWT